MSNLSLKVLNSVIDSSLRRPSLFVALFIITYTYLLGLGLAENPSAPLVKQEEEIYLSFRYHGGINTIVIAYVKNKSYYLPVTELFHLLSIDFEVDPANLAIKGFYLDPDQKYELNFMQRAVHMGETQLNITASDFLIKDVDFYVQPLVLKVIFGLDFTVDMSRLVLSLESSDVMPIVEQYERRTKHRKGMLTSSEQGESYQLLSGREKRVLAGGFIDYSLYGFLSSEGQLSSFNISTGGELLAGDIQGSVSGVTTALSSIVQYSDVRWRYVPDKRNLVSAVTLGQINSTGFTAQSFTGISFTNESIEPRQSYDDFIVEGTTVPESDVELYQNNRLVDFRKADEKGYYRFTVPLNYGTADLKLKIYGPSGGIIETARRIQVPYTFLPPGTVNYFLGIGKQQDSELAREEEKLQAQSNIVMGLTNWLTNKVGIDYIAGENQSHPVYYNSLSARLALEYLVNLDLAPAVYNKISVRALYPSAVSWGVDFIDYRPDDFKNPANLDRSLVINTYLPFKIKSIQQTARIGLNKLDFATNSRLTYNIDYSIFIRRIRFGTKYRDALQFSSGSVTESDGKLSLLAMYTIPRTPDIHPLIRGT